jgi:sigma-B regulation protein RsbU (phosphoserine phosphatase)
MNDPRTLQSVLVVEDHPDHRALAERALRRAGLDVRTATSGEDALTKVNGADLILVDYGLPRMNGIEFLEAIRAREGPPVVLVTGMGSEAIAVGALKGGAIDYIVKTPGYLSSLPDAVLRAWRAHDLAQRAAELQRLTLLVGAASDRTEVLSEIARGARTLLGATGCGVFVAGESGLTLEAFDGEGVIGQEALTGARPSAGELTDKLLVPLPGREGGDQGLLVVVTDEPRVYPQEEIELARTFASFAGMTLTNISRLELERDLAARLQEMLDMRTQLVESVSHEFRTPLTSILGFTQILLEHWPGFSEEQRHEMIGNIARNAEDLRGLVDELLDFSAVEHGKESVVLESFEIASVVNETVDSLRPLLADRTVELDVEASTVHGAPDLVHRALSNLLSNAVKYSEADTSITVRCRAVGSECRIEVVDNGRGLTPAETERAFEPFWRAKWARSPRGAGIGLYLVQQYARLQGGSSGVDSEPGKGSTFYFTLPLQT